MGTSNTVDTAALRTRVTEITSEARALGSTVEATIHEIETKLRTRLEERPYTTLAAAVGVGYVLGGGLPSRATSLLLALGGRVLLEAAVRDVTGRLNANSG